MNTLDEMNKRIEALKAEIEVLENSQEYKSGKENPKLKAAFDDLEAKLSVNENELSSLDVVKLMLNIAITMLKMYPQLKGVFAISNAISKKEKEIAALRKQISPPVVLLVPEKTKLRVTDDTAFDIEMFDRYPQLKPYKKLCIELDKFDTCFDETTDLAEGLKSMVKFAVKFITNYPRLKRLEKLVEEIKAEELQKAA